MGREFRVTHHAITRYRQRVDSTVSREDAESALRTAMRGARRLYVQADHRAVYAVDGDTYRVVVRHAPGRYPALLTILDPPTRDDEGIELDPLPAIQPALAVIAGETKSDLAQRVAELNAGFEARVEIERAQIETKYQRVVDIARTERDLAMARLVDAVSLLVRVVHGRHVPYELEMDIWDDFPEAFGKPPRPPGT